MRILVLAVLLAFSGAGWASCGNGGGPPSNGCKPDNGGGSGGNGGDGGTGIGVGVGIGYADADAKASADASAASYAGGGDANAYGGYASVGDVTNVAKGGEGGSALSVSEGGKGYGGNAEQGQSQSSKLSSTVNASSANDNKSSASGNSTAVNIGGDSTLVERNAPPVFLSAMIPTTCGGSISAGGSDRNGSGAFGLSWVGKECSIRMIGDRFQALGMVDTACEVYKSTRAYREAAKRNPKLAEVSCAVKPEAKPEPAPLVPQAFLEARVPRG